MAMARENMARFVTGRVGQTNVIVKMFKALVLCTLFY